MTMLTDVQLAVYRPWVWVQLGDLKINYPYGPDEKFRWLKDFRWTIGGTQGSGVEFTLFDNSPQSNVAGWFELIRTKVFEEKDQIVTFQWGISGRDQEGRGIRGVPQTGGFHASKIHKMTLSGVSMEYVEGGVNYKFSGMDDFAITQNVVSFDKIPDASFKEAVQKMITHLQSISVLPPVFNVTYDPEVDQFFPSINKKRDWPCQGFTYLLILHKWMYNIHSPQNIDRPDKEKLGLSVHPITIKDQIGIHFTVANYISKKPAVFNGKGEESLEIHVNPPDNGPLGPGRHTAISFRPEFKSNVYWAVDPALSSGDAMTRSIHHGEGTGHSSAQAAGSVDDTFTTKQKNEAVKSQVSGAAANEGSLFIGISAEVELLGIPDLDEITLLGKPINLYVWNPAYLNIGNAISPISGNRSVLGGWDRVPPLDDRWKPHEKRVVGISHYISTEGVYSTTLRLVPTGVQV